MALILVFSVQTAQAKPHRSHTMVGLHGKPTLLHRAGYTPKSADIAYLRPTRVRSRSGQIDPEVVNALRAARETIQADPILLLAIAYKESSFNPRARNRHSSARGLLQFTTTTWLSVIRDFGPRYGLSHLASAIRTQRNGQMSVATAEDRRQILALRDNPALQIAMAAERLAQERRSLELSLGRKATPADLYVLHLLGPTGARAFLTQVARNPNRSSIDVVGRVARPNLGLFVRNGHPLTTQEAYAAIQATLTEQVNRHAGLFDLQPL